MTSATDELRRLLDERGVEWWDSRYGKQIVFQVGDVKWFADDGCRDGMVELSTILITPEQAIAATLGRGTCRIEHRDTGYYCSKCDEEVGSDDPESELYIYANAIELWCFCPRCGSVVSA